MTYFPTNYIISAMAQVGSHQTDMPEAWRQSQAMRRGICGG